MALIRSHGRRSDTDPRSDRPQEDRRQSCHKYIGHGPFSLTGEDIARIADTYHAWKIGRHSGESRNPVDNSGKAAPYQDAPGFCKSATLEEVRKHGHVLTPGRYVGAEAQEDDGEPFAEKMQRLAAQLHEQQAEAAKLDAAIAANLQQLGF